MKIRNKKNGFSLLEVVLGLGLISLSMAVIYGNYNSKRVSANVDRQIALLGDITERAVAAFETSSNPMVTATTANFVNMRSIPTDLLDLTAGRINNVFGSTIEISGRNPLNDPLLAAPTSEADAGAITITINGVPEYACAKMATAPYADRSYELEINGVAVKTPGAPPSAAQIPAISASCALPSENVIAYTYSLYKPDLIPRIVGNGANRGKEAPQNIADIGAIPITAQACTGGSTWSAESTSCVCTATSFWNGSECVAFRSGIGNCEPSFQWNGNSCVPHNKLGEVTSDITLGAHDFDMPVGTMVQNPGIIQFDGRRIPQVGYPQEIITNWQENAVAPSGKFNKEICLTDADAPGVESGENSGYHCSFCTGGSVWNSTLQKCVK